MEYAKPAGVGHRRFYILALKPTANKSQISHHKSQIRWFDSISSPLGSTAMARVEDPRVYLLSAQHMGGSNGIKTTMPALRSLTIYEIDLEFFKSMLVHLHVPTISQPTLTFKSEPNGDLSVIRKWLESNNYRHIRELNITIERTNRASAVSELVMISHFLESMAASCLDFRTCFMTCGEYIDWAGSLSNCDGEAPP